jgi:hypothetical protein
MCWECRCREFASSTPTSGVNSLLGVARTVKADVCDVYGNLLNKDVKEIMMNIDAAMILVVSPVPEESLPFNARTDDERPPIL